MLDDFLCGGTHIPLRIGLQRRAWGLGTLWCRQFAAGLDDTILAMIPAFPVTSPDLSPLHTMKWVLMKELKNDIL